MSGKKRWTAWLLAGCMLAMTGCGEGKPETSETASEQASEAVSEQAQDTEAETPGEESTAAPQVYVSGGSRDWYNEDSTRWYLHAEYETPSVDGTGYEALSQSVAQWAAGQEASILARGEEYAGYAREDEGYQGDGESYQYSIFRTVETARSDSRALSLIVYDSEYMGGAHGNYAYTGVTFDAATGKKLEFTDILKDAGGFRAAATDKIIRYLKAQYGDRLFAEYEETVRTLWEREPDWYLDAAGMTFIFNPYEVGPFALGAVFATIPYGELEPYLKEAYQELPTKGVWKLPAGTVAAASGLRIAVGIDSDEYGAGAVYVELGNARTEVGDFARLGDAYLIQKEDGRMFVLLDADYASDDFVTFLYEITDGALREPDRLEGVSLQGGTVNTKLLTLRKHLDVLGSYNSMVNYTIDENGKLVPQSDRYGIDTEASWYIMVTVRELPVTMNGEESFLPVGSRIRITATDDAGTAYFKDEDTGAEGSISYVRGDGAEDNWTLYIDGVEESEYFETIPYAG